MAMVEPSNCWDAVANGIGGDEELDDILGILDFPMESLEGDGFADDWDITKSQCLGPIPSNVLMGMPMMPTNKINSGPSSLLSEPVPPTSKITKQKPQLNHFGPCINQQNELADIKEAAMFQTQSPVSVLESSGSCSKTLPIKTHKAIPVRTRSKRVRPTGVNPWLLISPFFSTSKKARKDKERTKKLSQGLEMVENLGASSSSSSSSQCPVVVTKKCTHCEVTKTPQWREGPLGPKTLCNACGVRYRSGRLFPEYRPAASPTFVPALHSNSHKKVIEMRSKGKKTGSKSEEPPISPQPEFVPMSSYLFDYI